MGLEYAAVVFPILFAIATGVPLGGFIVRVFHGAKSSDFALRATK